MAYVSPCAPEGLKKIARQATRWLRASEQDRDPGIRFLHASYGISAVDLLEQLATDEEVEATTGVKVLQVKERLAELQDQAQAELVQGNLLPWV